MRFFVTPTMLDEQRKHFIIRRLIGEVDWSGVDVLVVDMPPGTGEEVRGQAGTFHRGRRYRTAADLRGSGAQGCRNDIGISAASLGVC